MTWHPKKVMLVSPNQIFNRSSSLQLQTLNLLNWRTNPSNKTRKRRKLHDSSNQLNPKIIFKTQTNGSTLETSVRVPNGSLWGWPDSGIPTTDSINHSKRFNFWGMQLPQGSNQNIVLINKAFGSLLEINQLFMNFIIQCNRLVYFIM